MMSVAWKTPYCSRPGCQRPVAPGKRRYCADHASAPAPISEPLDFTLQPFVETQRRTIDELQTVTENLRLQLNEALVQLENTRIELADTRAQLDMRGEDSTSVITDHAMFLEQRVHELEKAVEDRDQRLQQCQISAQPETQDYSLEISAQIREQENIIEVNKHIIASLQNQLKQQRELTSNLLEQNHLISVRATDAERKVEEQQTITVQWRRFAIHNGILNEQCDCDECNSANSPSSSRYDVGSPVCQSSASPQSLTSAHIHMETPSSIVYGSPVYHAHGTVASGGM